MVAVLGDYVLVSQFANLLDFWGGAGFCAGIFNLRAGGDCCVGVGDFVVL